MKLTNCGITIDINPLEASRYLAAGYVEVKDEPVEIPAPPLNEPKVEEVRKQAKKAQAARKKEINART